MPNSIFQIRIYRTGPHGWAFDDEPRGITREPFVAGMPAIIDAMLRGQGHEAELVQSFEAQFSAAEFAGAPYVLHRSDQEFGGYWYRFDGATATPNCVSETQEDSDYGWLCPALFHFFDEAPDAIYVAIPDVEGRAEPK